jgi:uncharacterized short protein YbdD (DUF466 family)
MTYAKKATGSKCTASRRVCQRNINQWCNRYGKGWHIGGSIRCLWERPGFPDYKPGERPTAEEYIEKMKQKKPTRAQSTIKSKRRQSAEEYIEKMKQKKPTMAQSTNKSKRRQ